ncbi:type VI immunity family protein [uncultured Acinetobacter sp.]|uniref:type VI immunity family protein n=1 Tax=uncultured Acinetobacter sp. TaxID=165433 RepID=UPI002589A01B|nr:type VI immunity family protein [uncultured Acinetobacter sp.]
MNSYADLEPYLKDFQWLEHKKDQPSLFITGAEFQAHFLYFAGHSPEKRQALIECIEAYNRYFGEHLVWGGYYDDQGEGHYADLDDPRMPTIKQVIEKKSHPDDIIEWYCASGEQKEAPEYMISVMTNRGWQGHLLYCSEIKFCVPNKFIFDEEQKNILISLIQMFIDKLGAYHAVAGLQSILPYRPIAVGDYACTQGERFWGIYLGADESETNLIKNGIKSIDWLTYVSHTLIQRICEVKTFPKYCEHFNLQPQQQQEGFLFQLEEFPQLLPSNQPVLDSYYNLNKALRPLRNGAYWAISDDVGYNYKVLDVDESRKWIRRLDAPDIFPDRGHYQERAPAKKNIYLESGRPCEIDGIYRYDEQLDLDGQPMSVGFADRNHYEINSTDDYRQHVVLLKGDIAPRFLECYDHMVLKQAKKIKWHLVSEIVRVKNDQ